MDVRVGDLSGLRKDPRGLECVWYRKGVPHQENREHDEAKRGDGEEAEKNEVCLRRELTEAHGGAIVLQSQQTAQTCVLCKL